MMNMNVLSDEILDFLKTKHTRVYRNKAPKDVVFPYVLFMVESVTNTMPSEDLYLNVDVYEDVNNSVRDIEDLADFIDGDSNPLNPNGLNQKIINTDTFNLYFNREARQYVNSEELIGTHLINLRYVVRAYFK